VRKRPEHEDIRTFEEILSEGVASAVLHAGTLNIAEADNSIGRLRLLRKYAQIATTSDSKTSRTEFERAVDWYNGYGFPGLLNKDYRDGDMSHPVEIIFPIIQSAKNLTRLLLLYEMWRDLDAKGLNKLLVSVSDTESVEVELDRLAVPGERIARENSEIQWQHVAYLVKREKQKGNYQRSIGTQGVKAQFLKKDQQRRPRIQFLGIEYAYYTHQIDDWWVFSPARIGPLYAENVDANEQQVLRYAHDQLTKAANIMLRGVQPRLVSDLSSGESRFEYYFRCDWHIIAKSFAELICNKKLTLRDCIVCGKDINDLIKSAQKCTKCAKMKRT